MAPVPTPKPAPAPVRPDRRRPLREQIADLQNTNPELSLTQILFTLWYPQLKRQHQLRRANDPGFFARLQKRWQRHTEPFADEIDEAFNDSPGG